MLMAHQKHFQIDLSKNMEKSPKPEIGVGDFDFFHNFKVILNLKNNRLKYTQ
jgi:hypothetical protein